MKFAISGAQSTGKSTLVNELSHLQRYNDYVFYGGLTRKLQNQGFKINTEGDDATQLHIISKHIERFLPEKVITDRCALDGYVYTLYLYKKQKVTQQTLAIAESVFTNLAYDIIFYIKPEFKIVDDGVRSVDIQFQTDIVNLFDEVFESFNIQPIILSGSIPQRVAQFNENVDKYTNWLSKQPLKLVP